MSIVTVEDAKAHLNVADAADDTLIGNKIAAAEAWLGSYIGSPLSDSEAFPDGVPAPLQEAVLQLVAYWYEQREAVLIGVTTEAVPFGVYELAAPYKEPVF